MYLIRQSRREISFFISVSDFYLLRKRDVSHDIKRKKKRKGEGFSFLENILDGETVTKMTRKKYTQKYTKLNDFKYREKNSRVVCDVVV